MPVTEYTLTGFDDFLERRRVAFLDQVPITRVCSMCGLVPSSTVMLRCGHMLCPLCEGQATKGGQCPLDGAKFAEDDVVPFTFRQSDLEKLHVLCIAGGDKCGFSGKLCELKSHLARCTGDQVRCANCGQTIVRSATADHYQRCSEGHSASRQAGLTAADVEGVVEGLGDIKMGLERLRCLGATEPFDKESVVNDANSLLEHVTNLEREFGIAKETDCVQPKFQHLADKKATGAYGL